MALYTDKAFADAYFGAKLVAYAWTDETIERQNLALAEATFILEQLNYAGEKTDTDQELQFPRGGDIVIPDTIKQACCEVAYALLDGVEIEHEQKNVRATNLKFANVVSKFDSRMVPEHIVAGVPSWRAWLLLKPYLRSHETIKLTRQS